MQTIQTVKAYSNEWFEVGRYSKKLQGAVDLALKAAKMRGLFAAFIIIMVVFVFVGVRLVAHE